MSGGPLLAVDGLSVRVGRRLLLRDLGFVLAPGEALVVLGESGAGKSLLAQAIMGTLPEPLRASGDVVLAGRRSAAADRTARRAAWGRELVLLPQEPTLALDPLLPIGDQAHRLRRLVGGETRAVARTRVDAAMRDHGLATAIGRYPWQLSGGMAQRASALLARSGGARVLVADEPTKGLDAAWRDHAVATLRAVRDDGGCVVVVTHDLRIAHDLGGHLIVLKAGEIVEQGDTRTVLAQPAHPFTRQLIDADPSRWPAFPVASPGAPVLEARDISKRFGSLPVFEGIRFGLRAGERLAIRGPSGSGKSTLGNVVVGLLEPDLGQVVRIGDGRRGSFQKLYQDPSGSFAPRRTLDDSLGDVVALHRLDRRRLEARLERLGVPSEVLARRPSDVSGGELQRVALARVLSVDPVFLFADEPTSRLDPITQREAMAHLVEAVVERGIALLFVTHDDAIAAAVGSRRMTLERSGWS